VGIDGAPARVVLLK